jgi:hypothetical protein
MNEEDFEPCGLVEHDGGHYSLIFDDFHLTEDVFEEMGFEAGGYAWHGVVEALVRMKAPKLAKRLEYDPEASMFAVLSDDLEALKKVAELMRKAIANPALLKEAIQKADPNLMD